MRKAHAHHLKPPLLPLLWLALSFVCTAHAAAADEGELFVDDALPAESPQEPSFTPPPASPELPAVQPAEQSSPPPPTPSKSVMAEGEDWEVAAEEEGLGYVVPPPERKDVGLDGITRKSTQSLINKYLTASGRAWIASALYESIPYRPYIREQLELRGMPMFLQYLPIVESNYRPTAVSPSGAVGLWQFMANSMHPYLKKNEYIDERLDPWKETDAALAKLAENYTVFGDWKLALVAYNMGGGALRRLLKAHPGKDYWYFAENGFLSKQAAEYVPKLIAVADVVENAEWHGAIEVAVSDKRIEGVKSEKFSYLKVTGVIRLSTVAEACELPVEVLQELNLELLKGHTPPGTSYRLRLPRGMANIAAQRLNARKSAAQSPPPDAPTAGTDNTPQEDSTQQSTAAPTGTPSGESANQQEGAAAAGSESGGTAAAGNTDAPAAPAAQEADPQGDTPAVDGTPASP